MRDGRTKLQHAAIGIDAVNTRADHSIVSDLIESLEGHAAVVDAHGEILLVNDPWRRFAHANGGDPSAYVGVNYQRVCEAGRSDSEEAALVLEGMARVLNGERNSYSLRYPCHSPHEQRWFIVYVRRFLRQGSVYLAVVHQPVSEKASIAADKRAAHAAAPAVEDALHANYQAATDLFAGIIRSASDAIIALDDVGYIALFNPAAERMLRCAASQALGGSLERFIPPRHRDEHARHVEAFAGSGVSSRHMGRQAEIVAMRADGEEFPAEATICQVPAAGRVLLAVILRDVTERKLVERSLSNSVERYHRLIAVIPDAVCIQCDGRIQLLNPACVALLGLASADVLLGGTLLSRFGAEDAEAISRLHDAVLLDPALTLQGEACLRPESGPTKHIELSVSAFQHDGQCCVLTIMRDVSVRKSAERALFESREQLRGLATALRTAREAEQTRIARNLHDELGQSLSLLKMHVLNLGAHIGQQEHDPLVLVHDAVVLVDETLASVRRLATELRPSMLDHLGLLPTIAWFADQFRKRSGVRVTVKLPEAVPIEDRDVATSWFRILQEALTNVLRHAKATAVGIRVFEADGAIRMTITDNGSGFDVAAARGRGFGLLGMQERAAEIGATLTMESEPGAGSRMELALPLPRV
jgi:PAS domain S-box-containing protein